MMYGKQATILLDHLDEGGLAIGFNQLREPLSWSRRLGATARHIGNKKLMFFLVSAFSVCSIHFPGRLFISLWSVKRAYRTKSKRRTDIYFHFSITIDITISPHLTSQTGKGCGLT